jgi:hypothetical protein
MHEIDRMRIRLTASGHLASPLAAAWDAFTLIQTLTDASAERSRDMYAAFMFAGATAAEGREAVGAAPSMPAGSGPPRRPRQPATEDAREIADELAAPATALGVLLAAAGHRAGNSGDWLACEHGGWQASRIRDLLAPDN